MNPRPTLRSRLPVWFTLFLLIVLGAALRFTGIEWDGFSHLHPDERFMSIVENDLRMPTTLKEYFFPSLSQLSPYNTDHANYLYGQFPLALTKVIAVKTGHDDYNGLYLVGRAINATFDTIAILLIFLLARLLAPRREADAAGVCAAAAYAFCVFSIQNAHFFTVDTPLAFWTLVACIGAVKLVQSTSPRQTFWALTICVLGLSLAIACKVSGVFVALPIGLAFVWRWRPWQRLERFTLAFLLMTIVTAMVYRISSPPFFQWDTWLNWRPNEAFLNSLAQQSAYVSGEAMMPPQYQWFLSTPILGPAKNLLFWTTGPFLGLAIVTGFALCVRDLLKKRGELEKRVSSAILLLFFVLIFLYVGSRFVHSIRYLLPLLPVGCTFAGLALGRLWYRVPEKRWRLAVPVILVPTLLYAIAFVSIYTRPTTRLQANEWFFKNYPNGTSIAVEHWDDSLPVGYDSRIAKFHMQNLTVFDEDKPEKIDTLYDVLSTSNTYVLSSPRAWNTIGRLPSRFPLMTEFYRKLWNGELGWEKAVTITSWPQLGPIQIPTLNAEEAFMIYDHPPVTIFRKKKELSRQQFRDLFKDVDYKGMVKS